MGQLKPEGRLPNATQASDLHNANVCGRQSLESLLQFCTSAEEDCWPAQIMLGKVQGAGAGHLCICPRKFKMKTIISQHHWKLSRPGTSASA